MRSPRAPWLFIAALAAAPLAPCGCASDDVVDCPVCPEVATPPPPPAEKAAQAPIDAAPLTTERRRTLTLMGFGPDGLIALDVSDDLMGSAYQVYDATKQQVVKSYVYTSFTAPQQWNKVKRIHKITDLDGASQTRPGGDLVLLGSDSDGWVVIYLMKGERAVPYFRIPRLVDEGGAPADVRVKRLAWSPDGRWAVVIHTQALKQPRPWEGDFLHVFAIQPERLPFE